MKKGNCLLCNPVCSEQNLTTAEWPHYKFMDFVMA